jgi:pimeloyl-ACP methyl ester carboxylesterase
LQIDTVTTAFQVVGDGAPVLLLHGLSGSSRWWRYNIGPLAEHFRVYVVDLTGFGASRGYRFALREAAGHLVKLIDQLGIARASVVGHSMGGHIAADLAAEYPERVERLVLVDAAVLPFGLSYVQHARSLAREVRRVRPDFLPILVTDALRAGPRTVWRAANDLLHADLSPKLERIGAPTLMIWGEHDALVPVTFGRLLRAAMPKTELVIIAGAGHNAMWDCPAPFNREVIAFLDGKAPVAGERWVGCEAR